MLYQTFGNQLTFCQSFRKAFQNQINSESNPVGVKTLPDPWQSSWKKLHPYQIHEKSYEHQLHPYQSPGKSFRHR